MSQITVPIDSVITGHPKPNKNPLYINFYRRKARKSLLFLFLLTILVSFGVAALATINIIIAFIALAALLVVMLICYRPVFGFYLVLFIVVSCEIYTTGDPISLVTFYLLNNLNVINKAIPIAATPMEILMVITLLAAWFHSARAGQKFWVKGFSARVWWIFGGTIVFGLGWGILRSGSEVNIAFWEARALTYSVLVFFLATHFLQDTRRWKHVSWLFILGVFVLMIVSFVRYVGAGFNTAGMDSLNGFNHETSLFFVMLVIYLGTQLSFGSWKGHRFFSAVLLLPAVYSTMISGRRAAFSSLAVAYGILLFILFIRKRKVFFITLTITIVVGVPYMAIFWNSTDSALGMPVRAFRTQIEGTSNARDYNSDLYRIIEKFNVHYTINYNKFLGIGFGQKYWAVIPVVDLNFSLQYYTPHANILWVWLKIGMLGFAFFWFVQCLGMFQLGQIIKYSRDGPLLSMSVLAGLSLVIILAFAYVDIALSSSRITVLMGVFLAMLDGYYRNLLPEIEKYGAKELIARNRPKIKPSF